MENISEHPGDQAGGEAGCIADVVAVAQLGPFQDAVAAHVAGSGVEAVARRQTTKLAARKTLRRAALAAPIDAVADLSLCCGAVSARNLTGVRPCARVTPDQ